jgi:hypothetical protein
MKNLIYICLAFLLVATTSCGDKASNKIKTANLEKAKERDSNMKSPPIATFNSREYDFGEIKEGEIIEGVFKITNDGESDLLITDAKATCGCTVPSWPREAIKPGDSAELKFTFNARNRSGKQSKSITLKTNTAKGNEILRVKGTVIKKETA